MLVLLFENCYFLSVLEAESLFYPLKLVIILKLTSFFLHYAAHIELKLILRTENIVFSLYI